MKHEKFERNSILLLVGILIVVAIGGAVEIAPLFWVNGTIEKIAGMRPYTPLELEGQKIYVSEGCNVCHSQMIRSLRDEVERYGHYSLAAESMYDHPFLWGSERTGPDLARVGGKYSDQWHLAHLADPRSVVPESIMPPYIHLEETDLDYSDIKEMLEASRDVGVPYTDEQVAHAREDLEAQVNPDGDGVDGLKARYGAKVSVRDFAGQPGRITKADALIAYLQMLGTLVDFKTYQAHAPENRR
ncbi:MAG: cytochrome-c oxidase, cbb3-type subunit II [Alphaproteobacteria bacterium 64-11]|nr:cytochrome-c oxidase, cbb3-type subunit II [Alphaproteobacteria bacterium]OJU13536.1 MAG: cytochrome-c oxidase, cbb3-type subunit II [Alphaproteobacteria bacterium 64-11]